MRLNVYKNISSIASRIRKEILGRCLPGDRIPSEREISRILGESHNRVHRALLMLIEEGTIHSTGGRRGMFFTPRLSRNSKSEKKPVTLKFSIPQASGAFQIRLWKRISELFHMLEPMVEIEFILNEKVSSDVGADCYLFWPPLMDCSPFQALDLSRIPEVSTMVDKITTAGIQYEKQFSLPLLHSPGVFWSHRNMLIKCGLKKEEFQEPYDCFRWGDILQDSGLCVHGFSFFGLIYHMANWGISLKREGNYLLLDPVKLKRFFTECSKYLSKYTVLNMSSAAGSLFHRGQQGILAGYLNSFPLTEKRFQLLGQPLRDDGFACQAIFMIAIGKNTQYEDVVYDFIRFLLTDHIQELFFDPNINFSVIDHIYRKQYQKVSAETGMFIPPFDIRGTDPMTYIDLLVFCGRYLNLESIEALIGYKNPDRVIENISRINILERRRLFLQTASDQLLKLYEPPIRYLREHGEL